MRYALALWMLVMGSAMAAESPAVSTGHVTATLVSESDTASPGLRVGLRMLVAPGWHIYWTNPGDAGVAPELSFALPQGTTAGNIQWPAPQRQPKGPLMTYGYSGEVLLAVPVTHPGGKLPIALAASWLVCEKICIPEEGSFRLDLPEGPATPSAQAALFAAADARMPRPSPFAARIAPDGVLTVDGAAAANATEAWFMPLTWGLIEPSAPQILTRGSDGFTLALKPGPQFKSGDGLDGVLVVKDRAGQEAALDLRAAPGPLSVPAIGMLHLLGLALLGGIVLNLMPCVFPILAIKAAGLARLSGTARGTAQLHALAYTAGVLAAFITIAAALLLARAAGQEAGWGFQFQSPVFVALMAWLMFAVGLNMSGVYAVGGGVSGIGQGLAGRGGHVGSFFTGLLAVVVATPCTAPFMGVAIGAALAAPAWVSFAVFATMGLGLAAPYVLLACIPALARALPRPGPWMEVLRGALAFPIYAAATWLVWVASQQTGPTGVLVVAGGMVLLGFAGWALGLAQRNGSRVARGAAVLALLALAAVLPGIVGLPQGDAVAAEAGVEKFSAARLAELQREGRPVFVNMTAAWCVTCLVNERVALGTDAVRQAFAAGGVAYLKGDWTRQDAAISAYLHAQGRDGVPLYVFYPAGGKPGAVLPQILTEGIMLAALKAG